MISCKRATELLSKSMEEPLSLAEELSLRVHLFICGFCTQFSRHILGMRKACEKKPEEIMGSCDSPDSRCMSDEAKRRLVERLRK